MKVEEIDKLQKAENTAMRRILKAPKWTAQAAIRGEIRISNMKARIARSRLPYLKGRLDCDSRRVFYATLKAIQTRRTGLWVFTLLL